MNNPIEKVALFASREHLDEQRFSTALGCRVLVLDRGIEYRGTYEPARWKDQDDQDDVPTTSQYPETGEQ